MHSGIDIGGVGYGSKVLASDDGQVMTSGYSSSYGNYVVISHGNGFSTLYAHLSKRSVKEGDKVQKGQVLGLTGSTGNSTGPHLHFEIRKDGATVNPLNYFDKSTYVIDD
jgi:murein DD-endopeptidase MepM/ murein hydrolase activator NlpD